MVEWVFETFSMLFEGISLLATVAFRIFVLVALVVISWGLIREFRKNPILITRRFLGLAVAVVIIIGSPFYALPILAEVGALELVPIPGIFWLIFFWAGGIISAFFIGSHIAGISDNNNE